MLTGLLGPFSGDAAMLELFQDEALIGSAIRYERGLALACAQTGLISQQNADAITSALEQIQINSPDIVNETKHAGTLAIPLVQKLRAAVREVSPDAADHVHLGSTSQDLIDTVSVMHYIRAGELITVAADRLCDTLVQLAKEHAETPMLGRTLMRGARPITFGLKVSNWLTGVDDGCRRFNAEASKLSLQFGGPIGTLSGLAGKGTDVASHLAATLGLPPPDLPWQTQRNDTVALACSIAIMSGGFKKVASDIALLGQDEIGEVFEAAMSGRGGSSAMRHKRNPTGAQQVLTGLQRIPALAATMLSSMGAEHERGIGGWQAEFGILAEMYIWIYDAIILLTATLAGLEVNRDVMKRNLARADVGEDVGEATMLIHRALEKHQRHD